MRRLVLRAAAAPGIREHLIQSPMGRQLARRFVAGETLDDGVRVARMLNAKGCSASLDHLGENTTNRSGAEAAAGAYLALLDRLAAERLDANISLKLTQLGLDIDQGLCESLLERIVARAHERGSFVSIDMESSAYTERTLALFRHVYKHYPDAVGPAIQAYLYRSGRDVRALIRLGARVRLCKGAYAEPPSVAYPRKQDVDRSFARLMELLLLLGHFPGIATHDARLIAHAQRFAAQWDIGPDRYEFQMLYGVRRDLQEALVGEGYRLRVYVPFGDAWYPYLTRRLAERPANLLFVLSSLIREAAPRAPR